MGSNPSRWRGPRNAVEMISPAEAAEFCHRVTGLLRTGGQIEAGERIMQIASPGEVQFRIDVPVKDAVLVREGARVKVYLDADLALKEKILAKTIPFDSKPGKFRPDDRLLTFLNQL